MALANEIDEKRKEIHSDSLSMSIGELEGIYDRDEIDIHPKFQRVLRWTPAQKTKLIESILLRIPLPPIFVAQDASGKWDVVDGVQRLGTIFEFLGVLRSKSNQRLPPLALEASALLPSLKGMQFQDGNPAFTSAERLDFRRSRLDLRIILKESDQSAKYELFERLNTGGSLASDQEVRNCVLVWSNEDRYDWMNRLSLEPSFKGCVELSGRLEQQQYRMELVLRFIVFRARPDPRIPDSDLGDFLNKENRRIAADGKFDEKGAAKKFQQTFQLINSAAGSDAFRRYDAAAKSFRGPFLISAFEAVAMGVGHNIDAWRKVPDPDKVLLDKIKKLWSKSDFTTQIGSGQAARDRIQASIPIGRNHFQP